MGSHDALMFIIALIRELQNVMPSCASNATVTFHSPSSKEKKRIQINNVSEVQDKIVQPIVRY